jgi:hypothetical protein
MPGFGRKHNDLGKIGLQSPSRGPAGDGELK